MSFTKVTNFQSFLNELEGEGQVLVKFEAEWCMPCRAMTSVVEEVVNQYPDLKVIAVDVDGEGMEEALQQYKVRSVPMFVHLRDGTIINSASGTVSKAELASLVEDV
jgi:thioredoxin 1